MVGVLVAPTGAQAASDRVAVVDQRYGVRIFSAGASRWTAGSALWSWKRPAGSGWKNLSEVKFRKQGSRYVVLVAASGGRAGIVDYSTRKLRRQFVPGGNPHAIELLPTGAAVVASSDPGKLTLYGKGRTSPAATKSFAKAHAVYWDSTIKRLWAAGGTRLCSYKVSGTATSPRLTNAACRSVTGNVHDLSPIYGSPAGLWMSNTRHVYQYDINRNQFWRAPGSIDTNKIKSVGNHSGGLVFTTRVVGKNGDGTYGHGNVWLYQLNGSYVGNRYLAGAAIYKARPVVWSYR
ncbi:DUF6528 family protein [Micromonospora sp. DT233]